MGGGAAPEDTACRQGREGMRFRVRVPGQGRVRARIEVPGGGELERISHESA